MSKTKRKSPKNMSKTKNKTPQSIASKEQPFAINPISLISMLDAEQKFEIAWRSYLAGQIFFMSGGCEEYKNLIQAAFHAMFSTAAFQSLDEPTQTRKMNMGVQLLILLDSIGELNDSTNDSITKSVEAKYNDLPQD